MIFIDGFMEQILNTEPPHIPKVKHPKRGFDDNSNEFYALLRLSFLTVLYFYFEDRTK